MANDTDARYARAYGTLEGAIKVALINLNCPPDDDLYPLIIMRTQSDLRGALNRAREEMEKNDGS